MARDPLSFLRGIPYADMMDPDEHLQWLDEMREVDTDDPWADSEDRP